MDVKEKRIYTLEDVARELGVSKTTVSRAISGKGRIGESTRRRVLEFIEEHDYRPNVMAQGLARKKTYNIGLILPTDYAVTEFPFFKDCMYGICQAASQYNYDVIISMQESENISKIQRIVSNRKVDGIILSRAVKDSAAQWYLKENGIPLVVIGPDVENDIASVDNKNEEASQELVEIMLMKGVERLALLGGSEFHSVTRSRYQGYEKAHRKLGRKVNSSLVFRNVDNRMKAMAAVEQALKAGADGILCMDDLICDLALQCLQQNHKKIPEDLKIASLYDNIQLELHNPPVSSVRFDTVSLGKKACITLLGLLGEKNDQENLEPGYQVILRESTK